MRAHVLSVYVVHVKERRDLNKHYVMSTFVKYFIFIHSFNHLSNPMRKVPLYSFFR